MVKPDTMANCFRDAGIGAAEEAEADDSDVCGLHSAMDGGEDLIRDLRSGGVDVPATVMFRDFAHADDDVVLCAEPTEDKILWQVLPQP